MSSPRNRLQSAHSSKSAKQDLPEPDRTITENLAIATTLLAVPGTMIYFALLIGIRMFRISLAGNLFAPLLLACIGMGLFMLALVGLISSVMHSVRTNRRDRFGILCIWLNGIILLGMIGFVVASPQFE